MESNSKPHEEEEETPQNPNYYYYYYYYYSQHQFISITLSLPTLIPTHFTFPPKTTPNSLKIPNQITSLCHQTLTLSSPLNPTKHLSKSFNSTVSSNPLQNPLSLTPRRPSDPFSGAAARRTAVVWFRNDLRVHDNESLISANNDSMSVLPVYCFDPRDYRKSASRFDKTGPYRASFLIESVSDLRKSLRSRGSDLIVRVGRPEAVVTELVKAVGADAVYSHSEVAYDEVKGEVNVEKVLKDQGVEVKYYWGSTLYHVDDLPFKLEDMPTDYGGFRDKVKGVKVRKTIEVVDRLRGLPAGGDVEPGEIPSLSDLGLSPTETMNQAKASGNATLVGGETEALKRLTKFASECKSEHAKDDTSLYGANFSCKISPWLAMGCLSPRSMFDELKKSASRTISSASSRKDGGDSGTNWLMYELLWRDFFRQANTLSWFLIMSVNY
ncbi:blue-light photoreceptor PHR2-like [Bidens hawaiensis]|uniref:blue-light photoreceptor PHR2-like n=1 Tax=Bidens hawaiensis TaxID=980011 RepID=UPI00404949CF